MPAGVNVRFFHSGLSRSFRQERGVPDGDIVFVHAGVLEAMRATDVPLRAFAKAFAENRRIWLWMPGKGSQLEELRSMAAALGVADRVWLPGYVAYETLPAIFAAADAGLSYLPEVEYYQGQPPMKVMEYLAAGLPVIASDVASHRVHVRPGANGLLANPTAEAYAEALLAFAGDPALRSRLRSTAPESVADITYDQIANRRLIPLYHELVAAH
jgi:glycosyltransferase involved in cell wall biosynthesis